MFFDRHRFSLVEWSTGWMEMFSIKWLTWSDPSEQVTQAPLDKLSNSGALWSPRSDWEKHLSYRVDPLWREHNHNVKQVRLNTILLLSFPGGMMLICSSAQVLFYSSAHVTWTGGQEKFTEIKENVKRTGITLQHGKCDNVSKGAHWAQLTDTHDIGSHNSSLMVESNVEERPSLRRKEAHPMTHDLANLGNPQPCPSLSLNWQPNLFVSNHWWNSNVKVNEEEGLTRKRHDISNLSLFPCFL